MAFSAAADYSRVAVLKVGDRIDDHVVHVQRPDRRSSTTFRTGKPRTRSTSIIYLDRMMLGLLQVPPRQGVVSTTPPTGPLIDQGVTIWTNQCATGAHSFSNIPWIQAGTANGFFKQGQYVVVGTGAQPGGSQDGKGGDASVSGVNKMLNTLLQAAGVTKTGGAAYDDFGDPSLPKGIFTEMKAA